LWTTQDSGVQWNPVRDNIALVNPKASSVECVMVRGQRVLLVGGRNGVYRASPTSLADMMAHPQSLRWSELGISLPNTIVNDIFYQNRFTDAAGTHGDTLVVGTQGRGVWKLDNASGFLDVPQDLTIDGNDLADTVRLRRSPDNPLMLEIFLNGSPTPRTIPATSIDGIIFNGYGGDD